MKMCAFCETVWGNIFICPKCEEYKGMMELNEAIEYLRLDPIDFEDFLVDCD